MSLPTRARTLSARVWRRAERRQLDPRAVAAFAEVGESARERIVEAVIARASA
jgi:hypothetical protein